MVSPWSLLLPCERPNPLQAAWSQVVTDRPPEADRVWWESSEPEQQPGLGDQLGSR